MGTSIFSLLLFLGNRQFVGYGWNGMPTYQDREDFPCPAIRFRESTAEIVALREKELGDWKSLSMEDKKACKGCSCLAKN